jgi:AbrB family looped-hinge helix DNA binding protein
MAHQDNMNSDIQQTEVRLGQQGRVVIPAPLRRALGLKPGQILVARIENGCLTLEKPEHILRRINARYAKVPGDVNLADELIHERRSEAKKEQD